MAETSQRHHFVPQFLLKRFTSSTGQLWQLDKKSGHPLQCSPLNASVVRDYYKVDPSSFTVELPESPEELLGRIETLAAPIIADMAKFEHGPNQRDRDVLSIFIVHLDVRGPAGRGRLEGVSRAFLQELTISLLEFPESFRDFKIQKGEFVDDSTTEQERTNMLRREKETGSLKLSDDNLTAVMLAAGAELSPIVADLGWVLLIAADGPQFIISDTPVVHFDVAAPTYASASWRSSPQAQTTIPIDPRHCLLVGQNLPEWRVEAADSATIEEINLRSYEAAGRWIYGSSQEADPRR